MDESMSGCAAEKDIDMPEQDLEMTESKTSSDIPSSDQDEIVLKIVSATYGPCEGKRLSNEPTAKIPYTRDVTPILRALLQLQEHQSTSTIPVADSEEEDPHLVRLQTIAGGIVGGMKRTSVTIQALHDGWNSMNVVFGDACPGTSKRLYIHYLLLSAHNTSSKTTEVHHVSFAEHEPVILRSRITFYQEDSKIQQATERLLKKNPKALQQNHHSENINNLQQHTSTSSSIQQPEEDEDELTLWVARRMGRSQSIDDFAQLSQSSSQDQSSRPRLRSATFETVLPMVLEFLQLTERVQCRLVCRLWRNIVRDWGVAAVIDFHQDMTRAFLRGIVTHSYFSLHSLRLSDFDELQPSDLHPSLPHLRKLRVLDISRCTNLQDETLQLVAQHLNDTLEVLYMKGLINVTDVGMMAICQACTKLRVLEISHIQSMTDASGVAIGQYLHNLRALYMRDNFRLTNQSIDAITANCTKLNQLTLWGCSKLTRLGSSAIRTTNAVDVDSPVVASTGNQDNEIPLNVYNQHAPLMACAERLVSLNLWGCLKLGDSFVTALEGMTKLRSLIVSECHKLTDKFAIVIAESLPQLLHLHLRYCKRLTDIGVSAIARGMNMLYSLDLSFCSRITAASICELLDLRRETLSELRLQECRQLLIARDPDDVDDHNNRRALRRQQQQQQARQSRPDRDGQSILRSLRSSKSSLSMLDLRCCGGHPRIDTAYPENETFVKGMIRLGFQQKTPGFFARPAQWNAIILSSALLGLVDHRVDKARGG
ncbi:F-box and leucine-rich repeat protein [Seminavis robusta]|uniref:F-box and leucine-rich repeat protein n=1 Tax=Seminavis robusta TaxID=568900 RepID=A0A9N8HKH7_9STRA|nr:F-box and leucine-rich repeat protein [Seminavis robusta]|eukprot:Sro758_g198010.1 F-box and leucine-rich repeat protein (767) ;mRNA; f:12069-14441